MVHTTQKGMAFMTIKGACFCNAIAYEIDGPLKEAAPA